MGVQKRPNRSCKIWVPSENPNTYIRFRIYGFFANHYVLTPNIPYTDLAPKLAILSSLPPNHLINSIL